MNLCKLICFFSVIYTPKKFNQAGYTVVYTVIPFGLSSTDSANKLCLHYTEQTEVKGQVCVC